MSQQSDLAEAVYARFSVAPVAAAHLVRELCHQWGAEHGAGSVHGFVREVAICLMNREDVEVGDVRGGRFVAWSLPAWDAGEKIDADLMALNTFLDDESQCVFRKRTTASRSTLIGCKGGASSAARREKTGPNAKMPKRFIPGQIPGLARGATSRCGFCASPVSPNRSAPEAT